jgi:hypothetical protein
MGEVVAAAAIGIVVGRWLQRRVRGRAHKPRALLLAAPAPLDFSDMNELLRKIREEAQRQHPVSMPIPGDGVPRG